MLERSPALACSLLAALGLSLMADLLTHLSAQVNQRQPVQHWLKQTALSQVILLSIAAGVWFGGTHG
ncbi:hypothetical protein [Parachitinimonas caeni]|uniref:Uncharacterized protein n=1 Tax=Parachitinimonas caeni TaxID=3031301 RepID=A0ABT7E1T6_9NEIS|nr:hypothetical protein [Parachitinimonas caeni]MDK2126266.1 hypothetical protein [Parachitinimonas caeni]